MAQNIVGEAKSCVDAGSAVATPSLSFLLSSVTMLKQALDDAVAGARVEQDRRCVCLNPLVSSGIARYCHFSCFSNVNNAPILLPSELLVPCSPALSDPAHERNCLPAYLVVGPHIFLHSVDVCMFRWLCV